MAADIKVVLSWVPEQLVRPRGGRAATQASNKKLDAADRLSDLVGGTAVGRGVENTDALKVGDLLPVPRLEAAIVSIRALRARIDKALQGTTETDAKARQQGELVDGLRRRLMLAKDEALSIWRDLPAGKSDADLAVRLMAVIGGRPGTEVL